MTKKIIALLCLFLVAVLFHLPRGDDYDFWWHIKYGEIFVHSGPWAVDHSVFSWTPANNDWKYVTWIGSSLLYLIYQLHCFPLFYLLNLALLFVPFFLYIKYLNSFGEKLEVSNILSLVLVTLVVTPMYFKPDSFSFLFFAVAVYIYFIAKEKNSALFYFYPLLFLIWVNTHGVFIFGYALIIVLFMGEFAAYLIAREEVMSSTMLLSFLYSIILSGLALCINPFGIHYLVYLADSLSSSSYTKYFDRMVAYSRLWDFLYTQAIVVRVITTAWYLVLMFIVFLIVYVRTMRVRKKIFAPIILVNCVFFYLSMLHARSAFLYPLVWLFSNAYLLRGGLEKITPKRLSIVFLILIIIFSAFHIKTNLTINSRNTWFAVSYEDWFPETEAAFLKTNKIPGPLFNDYLSGGYLIWRLYPEYKVFVDTRYGPYSDSVTSDWGLLKDDPSEGNFKTFIDKYGFKSAFVNVLEGEILKCFLYSPDWRLIYFGSNAAIFIRTDISKDLTLNIPQLSAERFSQLNNPVALGSIFGIYMSRSDVHNMSIIRDIYQKNIPSYYIFYDIHLARMNNILRYYSDLQEGRH